MREKDRKRRRMGRGVRRRRGGEGREGVCIDVITGEATILNIGSQCSLK